MTRGFGGFPSPFSIVESLVAWMFPRLKRTLSRTTTMPATMSLTPSRVGVAEVGKKQVPYISFDAVVGRNSAFHLLTNEQLDEIGGVEYRALNALLWIVATVRFGLHFSFKWTLVTEAHFSVPYRYPAHRIHDYCSLHFN
jgi:hypothetical protein